MTSEKYATAKQIDYIRKLCEITGETPPRNIWDTDFPMASAHKLIDDLKHLRDVQAADKAYALDKEREAQRQVVLKPVPQSKPNWQQRLHAMLSEVAEEVLHCQQKAQDAVVSCDRILERIAPTIAFLTSNKQAHQPDLGYLQGCANILNPMPDEEPVESGYGSYVREDPHYSDDEKNEADKRWVEDAMGSPVPQPSNDQDPPCPF